MNEAYLTDNGRARQSISVSPTIIIRAHVCLPNTRQGVSESVTVLLQRHRGLFADSG
jgi:hypothetical protein